MKSIVRKQGNAAYFLCSCLIDIDKGWQKIATLHNPGEAMMKKSKADTTELHWLREKSPENSTISTNYPCCMFTRPN